jgi:chemotaxis protein MotB
MSPEAEKPRVIVKKKKAGHGAHHGGAWKVAYADFVTAMMALFMVLWLLTQADMKLRQQIAQYFRDPGVLPGGAVVTPDPQAARSREPKVVSREIILAPSDSEQELLEAGKKAIEKEIARAARENPQLAKLLDQVIVQVTDAGLSIQVVDRGRDLLFDLASAEVKPALRELLQHLARQLGQLPNGIRIGGHTDSRPFAPGAKMTNWQLAFDRANAARTILERGGLRPGQVNRVISFADTQPLVPENPLADENRRLSILAERDGAPPPASPDDEGPNLLGG